MVPSVPNKYAEQLRSIPCDTAPTINMYYPHMFCTIALSIRPEYPVLCVIFVLLKHSTIPVKEL